MARLAGSVHGVVVQITSEARAGRRARAASAADAVLTGNFT